MISRFGSPSGDERAQFQGQAMKFSVVTISYNQVQFLERTIQSVLVQKDVEFEYIIVDPGSNDGSRELIERYSNCFAHIVLEQDNGPADGLNKGFAKATGDIYCYINSDDVFELDAFRRVANAFEQRPYVDVFCGHAWVTDPNDTRLRRVWSDPFDPISVAYGESIFVQPSTFIKAEVFRNTNGFNTQNRSNWDGELLVSLWKHKARIEVINEFLSNYRLHCVSITNSGALEDRIKEWRLQCFEKIMGRQWSTPDNFIKLFWKLRRQVRNPQAMCERLFLGPVYKRNV
jgi:glycosyltransferase involved in cell wall biosynthesis